MKAVFVDPSGRRRRLARRAGICLAVPAAGYVVLLASTMLGGPTVHTPWVPVPDGARQVSEPRPDRPATTPGRGAVPTTAPTDAPTDRPTETPIVEVVDRTPVTPSETVPPTTTPPTAPPTTTPTTVPTTTPTTTQPSTPGQTRRPTAPPGRSSHSPTTPKKP